MITPLTKEQAIILTGYTGIVFVQPFSLFHGDAERRLGRPIFTHEFANPKVRDELEKLYTEDFNILVGQTNN